MKNIKTFESWKNGIIDNSLFKSGKAKYDPTVHNGTIKYKTGLSYPYYFAEIKKNGDKFICKIYKKTKDGEDNLIRNKIKTDLKLAHNYVREFLNQKLNKKKKRKEKKEENEIIDDPMILPRKITPITPPPMPTSNPPKSKSIIRRFN